MSIKGIDAQMMVTRTAEYSRESSAQMRRNDMLQDVLKAQSEVFEAIEKKKVAKTQESEQVGLQFDTDGGASFSGEPAPHSKKRKTDKEDEGERPAEAGGSIIDIKI